MYDHLTIDELQQIGNAGDQQAIFALGKRVLDFTFCDDDIASRYWCKHKIELDELEYALACEIPPECPHCGKYIGDV